MMCSVVNFGYLLASILFIFSIKGLSSPSTAKTGNILGIVGMIIAIVSTLFKAKGILWIVLALCIGGGIGITIARQIAMTSLPQLMAAFHSLVGLSAVFVALSVLLSPSSFGIHLCYSVMIEMSLGCCIGAITFSGSVLAFLKLDGKFNKKILPMHAVLSIIFSIVTLGLIILLVTSHSLIAFLMLVIFAMLVGWMLVWPVGGADMPVIVSMLNSYSGWAACGIGLTTSNNVMIVTGAIVGASGAILSYIMCKSMNRSIVKVLLGGLVATSSVAEDTKSNEERPVKSASAIDVAEILRHCSSVIIVPGYGMAVAQAQHAIKEMADILCAHDVNVRYAIHPVAGRMPGHMNVLLAEASIPYDDIVELEDINSDFAITDLVFVIGANDVTNPAAKTDPTSSIYGMSVLDVEKARTVIFVKRSMATGYSGVDNELFYRQNTLMLFGDAKKVTEQLVRHLHDVFGD